MWSTRASATSSLESRGGLNLQRYLHVLHYLSSAACSRSSQSVICTMSLFPAFQFFCQEHFPHGHLASITSLFIHRELMALIMRQNGAYTRTWVGGLRYLEVCMLRQEVGGLYSSHLRGPLPSLCFWMTNDLIWLLRRPIASSGWTVPTGAMTIGCQESPITQPAWRTVWRCCRLVRVSRFRSALKAFIPLLSWTECEYWTSAPLGVLSAVCLTFRKRQV